MTDPYPPGGSTPPPWPGSGSASPWPSAEPPPLGPPSSGQPPGPPGPFPNPGRPQGPPPHDGSTTYRPSGWWFLVGVGLLVAAVAVFGALLVTTLGDFLETDVVVADDGQPHAVAVGIDRDRMVWARDGQVSDCSIVDTATGVAVVTSFVTASYTRTDGNGAFHGEYRIDPGSGRLEITCAASGSDILIGPAPGFAGFFGGVALAIGALLVLGGAGAVILLVTTILFVTRPPRPPRPTISAVDLGR